MKKLISPGKADVIKLADNRTLIIKEIFQVRIDTSKLALGREGKLLALAEIYTKLSTLNMTQSIIFVETVDDCNAIFELLTRLGYKCSNLHGSLPNYKRDALMVFNTLRSFRSLLL